MIHQELRAIGENSATDGQVLPRYLVISKDPLPPSAEEFTQESTKERAERHECFENRSSGHVQQGSSAQHHNPDNESAADETSPKAEGSEMEKSEMTRRRTAGKRAFQEDVSVSSKKERLECTDLSVHFQRDRWRRLMQNCDCDCGEKDLLLTTKLIRARNHV